MTLDVPSDLLYAVARALEGQARWYREDRGHPADGIAALNRDADRLDAIAAYIDAYEVQS